MKIKIKYIGEDIFLSLLNGKIYECIGIEDDLVRVIDEENEDYLYAILRPKPLDNSSEGGIWEVIEDTEDNLFGKALNKYIESAKKRNYDFVSDKERILKKYNN